MINELTTLVEWDTQRLGARVYESDSDDQLIARALRSDRGAFAALMARHSKAVYLFAWGVTRSASDAEDITQDVFVVAWAKLREIRIAGSSALPWLLVTCRNMIRNHVRRASYRGVVSLDEAIATEGVTTHADELRWVMQEIEKLGGVDQRICTLCLIEGYSYSEASAQLGLSQSAIAKRVERIRVSLRATVRGQA